MFTVSPETSDTVIKYDNKVCEVPCYFVPHQKNLKAYITTAGSKDKLIASISKFRDESRVKILTAAIKAHK